MPPTKPICPATEEIFVRLKNFTGWLTAYGETSWDFQSYYSSRFGGWAKGVYYKHNWLGMAAVAPMVFSEAFVPGARRLFYRRQRMPIADAHYAMGFAFLHETSGEAKWLDRAEHFLQVLIETRSPGQKDYCWGYPFDWVWRGGIIKKGTPLITTTPYVFEAFMQVQKLRPTDERERIMASIVRHALTEITDSKFSETAMTCSYTPEVKGLVINASAYRAGLLAQAAKFLGPEGWLDTAMRNVNFVLETQNADGSWPYAVDGVRDFVDHFHTCFVMKALAKIYFLNRDPRILAALTKGVDYYLKNLFGKDGMPRPFSKAPRLTVYRCELYDCAECINLCLLLRRDFPRLEETLQTVVAGVLEDWIKPDASFRSRKLLLGWDNVPMHRWAQSQMFRSLAFYLKEKAGRKKQKAEISGQAFASVR